MDLLTIVLLLVCIMVGILCGLQFSRLSKLQTLVDRDKNLSQMISAFPQSMFLLNKDKIIIGIYNILPEAMAGHSKEEIIGNHISVYADDPSSPFHQVCLRINALFDEVKTGKPIQFEYMILNAHFEATIIEIEDGKVLIQVRNVSEIVQSRQEIESINQTKLSVALAAGGMASWYYDVKEDKVIFVHDSESDNPVNGAKLCEIMEYFVPKYRPEVERLFSDLIHRCSERYEATVQVYHLDQSIVWQQIYALPYEYDKDGNVIRIVGFQRDITQAKIDQQELELNRRKLEFAIRVAGMQQWEFNVKEDTFASEQGSFPDNGSYSFEGVLKMIHPSDHFLFQQELSKIIEKQSDAIHIQMRVMRPHGDFEWFTVDAAPFILDEETGKPTQIIGLLCNIQERVKMTNELIELRDKAEESNRLKSSFLANMSHEIRTPLNAIVGFSNLISQANSKEEIDEYLKIIENNNELLLTLIDDILDLSRIETGKIKFSYSIISINQLLEQLQQSTQLRVKPGVEVRLEKFDEETTLYSDMSRVTQIISNFLNNAAKFTYKGSITLGCTRVETGFRIHVTDTGIGISKDNLPKIFNRFIKLNPNIQGTGLGLSICSMIVQLLGGMIGAESQEGKGSTFWCILPSMKNETLPCEAQTYRPSLLDSHSDGLHLEVTGKKILIAEDNKNNITLYLNILKGYEIVHAWNGAQAIEMFHRDTPDLIIMDLSMPLMDGFKATSIIREHAPNIPIIAVSASVLPEERTMALSNGFTDFVMKPIDIDSFRLLVHHYCE